jgi:hypothetical protein
MKSILLRFPHLGQQINIKDLNKCFKISRSCKAFLEDQKFFWIRSFVQINKDSNVLDFSLSHDNCVFLENLLNNSNWKDVQEWIQFQRLTNKIIGITLFIYFAILNQQTETLKKLFKKSRFEDNRVMTHIIRKHAFAMGHLENFRFIIRNPEERNANFCNCGDSVTPLYNAAENGHLEICEQIFPYSKNNNSRSTEYDDSPLDLVAIKDYFDVYRR